VRRVLAISIVVAAVTSSCGGATSPEPAPASVVAESTTTTAPTITSSRPPPTPDAAESSDSDLSTEEVLPVDMADPERLISLDMGVDVAVSTVSRTQGVIDPIQGQVIWVPVGDRDAGPGEEGLVLMAAHLNTGEPFYNLVDDSAKDRKHGVNDHGVSVGAVFDFRLVDGTVCRYLVIEPFGVGIEGVEAVPGQPAIYFPKQAEVMNPILAQLITDVGKRPIVMMWVSYAGPNNDQWKPNGRNRLNNAVVFSQLDLCRDSENG
jgi:hypothetical protein